MDRVGPVPAGAINVCHIVNITKDRQRMNVKMDTSRRRVEQVKYTGKAMTGYGGINR